MINLQNATGIEVSNATTEVVSAIDNTKGVVIHYLSVTGQNNNQTAHIKFGTNFLKKWSNLGTTSLGTINYSVADIFVPKGQAIELASSNAVNVINMFYEVL